MACHVPFGCHVCTPVSVASQILPFVSAMTALTLMFVLSHDAPSGCKTWRCELLAANNRPRTAQIFLIGEPAKLPVTPAQRGEYWNNV